MVHIGIIPDGNRRWCKQNNKDYCDLVDHWINKMLLKYINEYINSTDNNYIDFNDITEVSLYVSSIDNLDRVDKTHELGYDLIRKLYTIYKNCKDTFNAGDIEKLKGFLSLFEIQPLFNGSINMNLALAYNYKNDLINFVNKNNYYYNRNQSNIDLVIRSGGEQRISGFYPTKIIYSELYFIEKMWPDITLKDISDAIAYYNTRQRRYGK